MLSNIIQHPKTTLLGIITLLTTVLPVLIAQGVTLGHAGTGSVVQLIGGVLGALSLALAKDPGATSIPDAPASRPTSNLRSLAIVALLMPLSFAPAGCTGPQVAQDIVNWTPTVISTANTVTSVVASLAPADAAIIGAATAGFDAAANLLSQQAQAYLAHPSSTALGVLQTQVTALQQNVNKALLAALSISSSAQQKVLAAIQGLATAVTAVLALVASISSSGAKANMTAAAVVKVAQIKPLLLSPASVDVIAVHYSVDHDHAFAMARGNLDALAAAGF